MAFQEWIDEVRRFDFADLDLDNIGAWPLLVRVAVWLLVFVLCVVGGYFYFIADLRVELAAAEAKELQLKQEFEKKAFRAAAGRCAGAHGSALRVPPRGRCVPPSCAYGRAANRTARVFHVRRPRAARSAVEQGVDVFRRSAEYGAAVRDHDRTFDQDRVCDHRRDQGVVVERVVGEIQLAVHGFALAHESARREPEQVQQFAQRRRIRRRFQVFDHNRLEAALVEQFECFARLGTPRIMVDSDGHVWFPVRIADPGADGL